MFNQTREQILANRIVSSSYSSEKLENLIKDMFVNVANATQIFEKAFTIANKQLKHTAEIVKAREEEIKHNFNLSQLQLTSLHYILEKESLENCEFDVFKATFTAKFLQFYAPNTLGSVDFSQYDDEKLSSLQNKLCSYNFLVHLQNELCDRLDIAKQAYDDSKLILREENTCRII